MIEEVSIIDYGLGNIYSIQKAIDLLGYSSKLIRCPEEIQHASHVVLPGVGAFPYAMNVLSKDGLNEAIVEYANAGGRLLGICLGMQLLFSQSEENGLSTGLQLLNGTVKKFPNYEGYAVPQVQWNQVSMQDRSILMSCINNNEYFYFLHSFFVEPNDTANCEVGLSNYAGKDYISLVESGNVMGTQFHPEKSGKAGLKLINNFIRKG